MSKERASAVKKKPLCPSMEMDDFIMMQQQKDPSEDRQIDLEIEKLESRLRSKRKHSSIVPSENQVVVVPQQNEVDLVPVENQGKGSNENSMCYLCISSFLSFIDNLCSLLRSNKKYQRAYKFV